MKLTSNTTGFPNEVCIFPSRLLVDESHSESPVTFHVIPISIKADTGKKKVHLFLIFFFRIFPEYVIFLVTVHSCFPVMNLIKSFVQLVGSF